MARLTLEGLGKSFRGKPVLEGLDLAVAAGETVAVAGPSGGGKTLLLRLIAGLLEPDTGDILIDGRSVRGLGPEVRGIGMAFQNFALYPHLPAFENIASPLRAAGLGDREVRRRVGAVASLLRIDHVLHHAPRELSNGQKQRTSLARALVREPGLLLLDDPLRNVDAKLRYEMRLELPRLLRETGSAVLYVTQDYREAMALGDRVGVLQGGRFAQIATPAAIYAEPGNVEIARLFGDPTINLFACRPQRRDGALEVTLFGAPLRLDPAPPAAVGRDCLLGLRAHDIEVEAEPALGALPFELDAVTPLNLHALMLLRAPDGSELLASCAEERALRFGRGHRQVWVRVDAARAHLFDATSGQRLAPEGGQG